MSLFESEYSAAMFKKITVWMFGKARNPLEEGVFHNLSLVALLAWVGLGADGLSSSAYGPEESFRALGVHHQFLALYLAAAMALTVFIISASYNRIISLFPSGGGGYVVTSKLLGAEAGVVSGTALVVDYILTIAVSVTSGVDALFSFFPAAWGMYKLSATIGLILVLIWLNMRGVKESIQVLLPIFLVFLATHLLLILYGIFSHTAILPSVVHGAWQDTHQIVSRPGGWMLLCALLFKAYSMGGGTYTGIEAVSNGMASLREPRVKTGRQTMMYMATSLAFTAGGILLCYMLWDITAVPGKTMNASLIEKVFSGWRLGTLNLAPALLLITLLAEALLLLVAAQTGFVGGPQVLSNMAVDSWMPRRFGNLSNRLVHQNGVLFMGLTTLAVVWLAGANIHFLVVLYSINVFLTFTLSQLSMCLHWLHDRSKGRLWNLFINGMGMILTAVILVITVFEKFFQGGWVTIAITGGVIVLCYVIKNHYNDVGKALKRLDDLLINLPFPSQERQLQACDLSAPTAVLMVNGYNGLGIHSIYSIRKLFQDKFKNLIFIAVGRVDASKFKGVEEMDRLQKSTEQGLQKYVELAQHMGYCSMFRYAIGTDVTGELENICKNLSSQFSDSFFFAGKLIFARENMFSKLLHNEVALEIQRRLLFQGLNMVVVPIRVL